MVFAEWHFLAQNLCYFILKKFANFWESFAHEEEQLLRNIPHFSTSLATRLAHIFAQNYLGKNQNYAKLFAKFSHKPNYANSKIAQKKHFAPKQNFCVKTKV